MPPSEDQRLSSLYEDRYFCRAPWRRPSVVRHCQAHSHLFGWSYMNTCLGLRSCFGRLYILSFCWLHQKTTSLGQQDVSLLPVLNQLMAAQSAYCCLRLFIKGSADTSNLSKQCYKRRAACLRNNLTYKQERMVMSFLSSLYSKSDLIWLSFFYFGAFSTLIPPAPSLSGRWSSPEHSLSQTSVHIFIHLNLTHNRALIQ